MAATATMSRPCDGAVSDEVMSVLDPGKIPGPGAVRGDDYDLENLGSISLFWKFHGKNGIRDFLGGQTSRGQYMRGAARSAGGIHLVPGDHRVERLHLLDDRFAGRGRLLDERSVLLSAFIHEADGTIDLLDADRLLAARGRDLRNDGRDLLHRADDPFERAARLVYEARALGH